MSKQSTVVDIICVVFNTVKYSSITKIHIYNVKDFSFTNNFMNKFFSHTFEIWSVVAQSLRVMNDARCCSISGHGLTLD